MKYILFVVGVILGLIISPLITDSGFMQWIIRLGLGVIGYNIPAFIKYNNASPKQRLAFHGENSPLSRSKSVKELSVFISQLEEGGLIQGINETINSIAVHKTKWDELTITERTAFAQIMAQFFNLTEEEDSVLVASTEMDLLASYSPEEGYVNKDQGEGVQPSREAPA